jgi:hypothetical protein
MIVWQAYDSCANPQGRITAKTATAQDSKCTEMTMRWSIQTILATAPKKNAHANMRVCMLSR